ncbi:MAG: hypothetical protein ACOC44_13740 [Promethearchaeia archaeon]
MNHSEENSTQKTQIICCVKNCQRKITKEQAITIKGKYFCGVCGAAYYRSNLNF